MHGTRFHRFATIILVFLGPTSVCLLTGCRQDRESSPTGTQPTRAGDSQSGAASDTQPAAATGPASTQPFAPPAPTAADERREQRLRMVDRQIANPVDRRTPVTDPDVLEAMRATPRHVFVPLEVRSLAYADRPLPIGHNQTISQPYIVALMTELLQVSGVSRILEVGTGSGYQAAVLAHLTPHVYTIEIVEPLCRRARQTLEEQGYDEVKCRCGDGYGGWPEAAPFDGIIVTCAADELPEPLWEQLAPGGRIVIPIGPQHTVQELVVITKTLDGQQKRQMVIPVSFVPLTRKQTP